MKKSILILFAVLSFAVAGQAGASYYGDYDNSYYPYSYSSFQPYQSEYIPTYPSPLETTLGDIFSIVNRYRFYYYPAAPTYYPSLYNFTHFSYPPYQYQSYSYQRYYSPWY